MSARGGEDDNDDVSGGDFDHKLVKLAVRGVAIQVT